MAGLRRANHLSAGSGHGLRRRWPRALWVAVVLAVGAHVVLWASMRAGWSGKAGHVLDHPIAPVGGAATAAASGARPGPAAIRLRLTSLTVPSVDALATLPSPQPQPQPQPPPVSLAAPPTAMSDDGARAGAVAAYWPSDQLNQVPQPVAGWVLDEEALASLRQGRLQVRLWVSADGGIDRVALLSAEPPGAWAARAIQPLATTRMQAGRRGGGAVPSTLVVEITSEIERFR